jgi:hypothetical protein
MKALPLVVGTLLFVLGIFSASIAMGLFAERPYRYFSEHLNSVERTARMLWEFETDPEYTLIMDRLSRLPEGSLRDAALFEIVSFRQGVSFKLFNAHYGEVKILSPQRDNIDDIINDPDIRYSQLCYVSSNFYAGHKIGMNDMFLESRMSHNVIHVFGDGSWKQYRLRDN